MKKVFAVLLLLVMALTLTSMQTTRADSNRCSECGRVYGWGNIGNGMHMYACWNNQCSEYKKAIKTEPHVYDGEPTCTEPVFCKVCHGGMIGSLGHDFSVSVAAKAATCTEAGYTAYKKCSRCGEKNEEYQVIPATGKHTFEWVTDEEPTCTEAGQKHEECSVCSAKRSEGTEIPATGLHTVVTDKGKAATCTKAGLTAGKHCSVCGQVLKKQKKVSAKGHLYQSWAPAEDGKHRAACVRCSHETVGDCVVVAVPQADPNAAPINLCPVCGHREGGDLVPVTDARAKGGTGDPAVFMTEGEEERLLTVSFQRNGKLQQSKGTVTLTLPAAVVEGYDLLLIGSDGTESPITTKASSGGVTFTLSFGNDGPVCFLRLQPQV